MFETDFIV